MTLEGPASEHGVRVSQETVIIEYPDVVEGLLSSERKVALPISLSSQDLLYRESLRQSLSTLPSKSLLLATHLAAKTTKRRPMSHYQNALRPTSNWTTGLSNSTQSAFELGDALNHVQVLSPQLLHSRGHNRTSCISATTRD